MKRLIVALALLQSFCVFAQDDTLPKHGTIRVAKHHDSTYIKAYAKFLVYANNPAGDFSYQDYVMQIYQNSYKNTNNIRVKINAARPKWGDTAAFNYTMYFRKNHYTKDIKMRPLETDTVRLLINVDNKGVVKFTDLVKTRKYAGVSYVMRNEPIVEFKEDKCHLETQNAFKELTMEKWIPGVISQLKTHPSQRKNPYKTTNGYTQGILTVIYSGEPLD